jgi:hypothetical protein
MNIIKKKIILEGAELRQEIRTIVRDIINIFKNEDEGGFYLPNDLRDDEFKYDFPKFDLELELTLQPSENVDDFLLNAVYYRNEGIISIVIVYNPKDKKTILYNLIGELNELVSHELRHIYQKTYGTHNIDVDEPEDPYEYYTQPHEIDAQVAGFKRMSQITKKPFEDVVRGWFEKNKDIHQMGDDEKENVIELILAN